MKESEKRRREKIGNFFRNRPLSEEHKRKLKKNHNPRSNLNLSRNSGTGRIPWNKGKSIGAGKDNPFFGKKHTKETVLKMSLAKKGKPGHKHSLEARKRAREIRLGSKSHLWKGGVTKLHKAIRNSLEYRLWRESVYKRDDWTCVWCKKRGGKLHPDHIKPFAYFPELRFAIDNGRTLCEGCHKKTDTYGPKANKYKGK